jgi:hypothetical protein
MPVIVFFDEMDSIFRTRGVGGLQRRRNLVHHQVDDGTRVINAQVSADAGPGSATASPMPAMGSVARLVMHQCPGQLGCRARRSRRGIEELTICASVELLVPGAAARLREGAG